MKCYIDSSVVLRHLLLGNRDLRKIQEFEKVGSSELLQIECSRVIQRYRLDGALTDSQLEEAFSHFREIYDAFYIFQIGNKIKQRAAGSFPTTIGTLDAIHLSTAELWLGQDREPLVIFTHDEQMKTCAHAMGIHTLDS